MKVLVIGSGGREHAIVDALAQSSHVSQIYAAPGNGGIQSQATLVPIAADDIWSLARFARTRVFSTNPVALSGAISGLSGVGGMSIESGALSALGEGGDTRPGCQVSYALWMLTPPLTTVGVGRRRHGLPGPLGWRRRLCCDQVIEPEFGHAVKGTLLLLSNDEGNRVLT